MSGRTHARGPRGPGALPWVTVPSAITLIPITPALAREASWPDRLAAAADLVLGEDAESIVAVVLETEALRRMTGDPPEWGGYLGVDPASREVVGTCSFKGEPDEDGAVEIAYLTFPRFQRRGVASAMATALTEIAFADARVRTVRAHTLADRNASARLLARLGFERAGDVYDPDEAGLVWRWERAAGG